MTKIIGHRGAAGLALENSPESIQAAAKLPIDGIEFDVRKTSDGKLVVLHDAHTERVADKRFVVASTSFETLRGLKLNNGQRVLTVDEALSLTGGMPVVLDIKVTGVAEELAKVIAKHKTKNITISSRKYTELRKIHALMPDVPFLAQSHVKPSEVIHIAHQLRATGISLNKWLMNPLTYHLAKRTNLEVRVYTVNHVWLLRFFTWLYPDVVMYTDHPERFIEFQRSHNERSV